MLNTLSYNPDSLLNTSDISTRAIIGNNDLISSTVNQVCLIKCSNGNYDNYGTGVLIAPNVVLTAAHVIYDYNLYGGWGFDNGWSIRVSPAGTTSSSPYGSYSPVLGVVGPGWTTSSKKGYKTLTYEELANDWGLLILNSNIGTTTGYMGVQWNSSTILLNQVSVRGYSMNPIVDQQWDSSGSIIYDDGSVLEHNCDTKGGASGGPIINSGGKICGINIGESVTGTYNTGIKITQNLYSL